MTSLVSCASPLVDPFNSGGAVGGAVGGGLEGVGSELDIDGLPLRDPGMKVNLKSILGHMPQVDDDEDNTSAGGSSTASSSQGQTGYRGQSLSVGLSSLVPQEEDEYEYEGGEEEEDEVEEERVRGERKLQRRSSLKTIQYDPTKTPTSDHEYGSVHSPDSMSKKGVRFADALGLGLEAVRDLLNSDEPPEIPQSALRDLHIRRRRSKTEGKFTLQLDFTQPGSSPDFLSRLHSDSVVLENCVTSDRDLTISGVVRVANVDYNKRVDIRYTVNSWTTHRDINAVYIPGSNDVISDRFMFTIHLPDSFGLAEARLGQSARVEFVVRYGAGEREYWDNNCGDNYAVTCALCSGAVGTGAATGTVT